MDISIKCHNKKNWDCENCIKRLAVFTNMPKFISVSGKIIKRVDMDLDRITIITDEMPARIDYDKYVGTIHIISNDEASYLHKPFSVLPQKKQAVTLWEYGERELTNIEEGCLLLV